MTECDSTIHVSIDGDFSFIDDRFSREIYEDAWNTIHLKPEYIEYIRQKSPRQAWVTNRDPIAVEIYSSMKLINKHSGCSVACTMRTMEYIIKNGWNAWVEKFNSPADDSGIDSDIDSE